jgi:6-phosphogluconolactonase
VKISLVAGLTLAATVMTGCILQLKYTVGGTVTGLQGTGLVIQDASGKNFTINASGTFTLSDKVANDGAYSVTVQTQPTNPAQTCSVQNGSGTINKANITNIIISCSTQSGRFAFVANETANSLSAYVIDSGTGILTAIAGSPFASSGGTPTALAVDPNGTYLYVANNTSSTVSAYLIDANSGALTPQGLLSATGTTPVAIAIAPAGHYLYVANMGSNTVSGYAVDPSGSGALTALAGSPFTVGAAPSALKITPDGSFLYVTNSLAASISGFAIDDTTGLLTPIAGTPFATGNGPISLTVDATGSFLYVANALAGNISEYSISASSGVLTAISGSPLGTTTQPSALASDPQGRYVYAANVTANNDVGSYSIAPTTGALSSIGAVAAGLMPASLAVDPSGLYLYVTNQSSNSVILYSVGAGGALTDAHAPIATGSQPTAIAID